MTNEQINIKIAELCGWKDIRRPIDDNYHDYPSDTLGWLMGRVAGIAPGDIHWQNARPIPNYAADLNACHEFEKLTAKQCREGDYWFYLREVLGFPYAESDWDKFYFFQAVHATARQRCEAFLRVHNQWEEEA